ncbi:50S ribosomal protein L10 [Virgibacillus dakarensis]|uniref:Large ribosomal subunit protein uL10 n=1 Tax=Lentibacillus populi TaxID=1827502 RepID=A0A9W5X6N0_9BACI|nr:MULTISPECIES: 50S ribosomal protein L10 [Bacillaceae]MBT2217176.1 50S ribosomal protein L10 [Virgibacillus dakarensis]MTW86417.1 50S ribosomal protein L10 [Virgibacillus dakarensis]GGB49632.1 50S ribosomal protein L10 [Lentibacillus populi]
MANSNIVAQKQQVVQDIADKFNASQSTLLVDYRGLDVAEVTELRKQLREANVEFKVYKNSMARRAVDSVELGELGEKLVGPTAIAFSNEDVIAPAKILNKFAKDHDALEIKGGVIEGKIATLDQIKELADLPNYEGMVSMLLSVLQAPIRNLAYAAKQVAEQKEEQGA